MDLRNRKTVSILVILLLIPFYVLNNLPHAEAATVANGYSVSNFATGFVNFVWGPIGIAMDTSGNLFVADARTNEVYKFGPAGGVASSAALATPSSGGFHNGLTFDKNGNLYLALETAGQVVQLNPADGTIIRTVASGLPTVSATGIATDPLSGDLFVSVVLSNTIYRISYF